MLKYFTLATCAVALFTGAPQSVRAQKCGTQLLMNHIEKRVPGAKTIMRQARDEQFLEAKAKSRTTATLSPIPVVFHIVLTQDQVDDLGGITGIDKRVQSQIRVLNEDFNALNKDSIKIPAHFKSLFGNANIQFGVAHRKPDGTSTPGYEIIIINDDGTEEGGSIGSGESFADAKYTNGVPNCWDYEKYFNVWVVNPLIMGMPIPILGVTTPPMAMGMGFPPEELGVVLHYGAFGVRESGVNFFIVDKGRTMTHEAGHFFGLWHTWGDDDGYCPDNGGDDDGIADTPPQADASSGCFTGIEYDACSQSGNGIMYQNYMDYSDDDCQHMFTKEQAQVMYSSVDGGELFTLTQHPEILQWPTGIAGVTQKAALMVYPNPATNMLYISSENDDTIESIRLLDMTGKTVMHNMVGSKTKHKIDIAHLPAGVYTLQCATNNGIAIEKIIVR